MGKKTEERPSFFKIVCSNDFTHVLRLPNVFILKYGSIFPKKAKLRIESGKTWVVKMEEMEDGLFFFTRGWNLFAQDVELKFGELLVFKLDDGGYVDVSVYGTNGCIKDVHYDGDDDDHDGRRRWREMRNPCYYEIVLKPHNRHRVTLKRKFVVAAGLMGKKSVELVWEKHNMCVMLDNRHRDANRVDLALGWAEFRRASGLVYWKTYSLEFKPNNNVIQIKEVDNTRV